MEEKTTELDLKGEVCPFTFVKTKLQLEQMESGDVLTVIFDHAPAIGNVPKSVRNEGHTVLGIDHIAANLWKVHIKKV
ncbi:sulfurtransferase TusA family protein [Methanohalophilus sp. RSK]|uniref:sulfurtransferase TusA family protein n=1 Tax=Methanohalophilus sp. RSK TaxID=2485783 RepID=UPI000F43E4BB|nr:sulfurtransferase TusA family protein [Methanohalophilus sp. RSK]RNI15007.1 sulfurtransferase TusA family protein [Methanohalophilus sp. RSK]